MTVSSVGTALGIAGPLALVFWCCGGTAYAMARLRPRVAHLFAPGSAAAQADHETRITELERRADAAAAAAPPPPPASWLSCWCVWMPGPLRTFFKWTTVLLLLVFCVHLLVTGLPATRDSLRAIVRATDRGRGFSPRDEI